MAYALQLFSNNAVSLLSSDFSATDISLTVMSGYGAQFPQPIGDGSDFFLVTLEDQSATHREIIRVTGRTGDTFHFPLVNRGQEGTSIQAWSSALGSDTLVDHRVTAETMRLAMRLPQAGAIVPPGAELVDDAFTFVTGATNTVLTTTQQFAPNSTKVHCAGLRLKRGVDFIESGLSEITLLFVMTQANMDDGSNVVVDYVVA
jgi:hypothetical protein